LAGRNAAAGARELDDLPVEFGSGELTAVGRRAVSSSRGTKSSRRRSTASGLATIPRGRAGLGDAAGSRDAVAASPDGVLAGQIPHPPDKP